jgi:hypothetical protein
MADMITINIMNINGRQLNISIDRFKMLFLRFIALVAKLTAVTSNTTIVKTAVTAIGMWAGSMFCIRTYPDKM